MNLQDPVPENNYIESRNPVTGEILGRVRQSSADDVKEAAVKARIAQKEWQDMGVEKRNRILNNLIGILLDQADEIASIVSDENGKPRSEAMGMILPISGNIKLHTKTATKFGKGVRVSPTFFVGSKANIVYEPLGVVGFILPWNFPFESGIKHMLPALASGNAVLQKPSPFQPMIGEMIKRLFHEAGVPDGLVQMVHGYGETGQAVIDHSDAVCFIGSTRIGREVALRAAKRLIPYVLELGGNDPAIVRHDADPEHTARGLVNGTCFNSGQVCNGTERIYAHKSIARSLTEHILKWVDQLKLSDGTATVYDIGPMTWPQQEEIYKRHTEDAISKGAVLEAGGKAVEVGKGRVWLPTVLSGMNHEMLMMREETFGPFLPIMEYENDEEAIQLANDSQYGLAASVWSRDTEKAKAMCRQLKGGHVMINNAVQSGGCATLPFGGEGDSGVGRLSGEQAFFNWVAPKSIMQSPKASKDLWMPYPSGAEIMVMGLAKGFFGRSPTEKISGWLKFLFRPKN